MVYGQSLTDILLRLIVMGHRGCMAMLHLEAIPHELELILGIAWKSLLKCLGALDLVGNLDPNEERVGAKDVHQLRWKLAEATHDVEKLRWERGASGQEALVNWNVRAASAQQSASAP